MIEEQELVLTKVIKNEKYKDNKSYLMFQKISKRDNTFIILLFKRYTV